MYSSALELFKILQLINKLSKHIHRKMSQAELSATGFERQFGGWMQYTRFIRIGICGCDGVIGSTVA